MPTLYPNENRDRDRWIVTRRPERNAVDPSRPYAFLMEEERAASGEVVNVATIFLTNRECPWKCLMCDLWKNTLTETVPVGAIPGQIEFALDQIRARGDARLAIKQIKLYNSGSFFDPKAILLEDYEAIAERVRRFDRVIVECHPALVNERCLPFRDLLVSDGHGHAATGDGTKLEVAMGLETAHPEVVKKLNKRMTLDLFSRAAAFLRENGIALRVFILVKPPFLDETEAIHWAKRSLDFAFQNGATVASLIPTRLGNGALEALAEHGQFSQPKLSALEETLAYGIGLRRGRVLADLWDLEQFSDCPVCFPMRAERLRLMNLRQEILANILCERCNSADEPTNCNEGAF